MSFNDFEVFDRYRMSSKTPYFAEENRAFASLHFITFIFDPSAKLIDYILNIPYFIEALRIASRRSIEPQNI